MEYFYIDLIFAFLFLFIYLVHRGKVEPKEKQLLNVLKTVSHYNFKLGE